MNVLWYQSHYTVAYTLWPLLPNLEFISLFPFKRVPILLIISVDRLIIGEIYLWHFRIITVLSIKFRIRRFRVTEIFDGFVEGFGIENHRILVPIVMHHYLTAILIPTAILLIFADTFVLATVFSLSHIILHFFSISTISFFFHINSTLRISSYRVLTLSFELVSCCSRQVSLLPRRWQ